METAVADVVALQEGGRLTARFQGVLGQLAPLDIAGVAEEIPAHAGEGRADVVVGRAAQEAAGHLEIGPGSIEDGHRSGREVAHDPERQPVAGYIHAGLVSGPGRRLPGLAVAQLLGGRSRSREIEEHRPDRLGDRRLAVLVGLDYQVELAFGKLHLRPREVAKTFDLDTLNPHSAPSPSSA